MRDAILFMPHAEFQSFDPRCTTFRFCPLRVRQLDCSTQSETFKFVPLRVGHLI